MKHESREPQQPSLLSPPSSPAPALSYSRKLCGETTIGVQPGQPRGFSSHDDSLVEGMKHPLCSGPRTHSSHCMQRVYSPQGGSSQRPRYPGHWHLFEGLFEPQTFRKHWTPLIYFVPPQPPLTFKPRPSPTNTELSGCMLFSNTNCPFAHQLCFW